MAYGQTADVRKLSGNPPSSEVNDTTINDEIANADALINVETGKSNWASSDVDFNAIRRASNFYAAAAILNIFDQTKTEVANSYREEFWKIIKSLKTSSKQAAPPENIMLKTAGSEE
ncbi:MAG: hypothetical protein HYY67_01740 [Thaumarchaeota archaeon]|nr:hypothetical protein [Nitrososphaerota archaeon]MCS4537568.1 hypothetical protein [Nitrososphaerota archaeon]